MNQIKIRRPLKGFIPWTCNCSHEFRIGWLGIRANTLITCPSCRAIYAVGEANVSKIHKDFEEDMLLLDRGRRRIIRRQFENAKPLTNAVIVDGKAMAKPLLQHCARSHL